MKMQNGVWVSFIAYRNLKHGILMSIQ